MVPPCASGVRTAGRARRGRASLALGVRLSTRDTIAADLQQLAVAQRFACTDGERRMADVVRGRLGEAARAEGVVAHPVPLLVLGVHGVLLSAAGAFGYATGAMGFAASLLGRWGPALGALGCLLVTISLVAEGTGRAALLRVWLPGAPSRNVVLPPASPGELGTVVIATPLDVPRARPPRGRMWHRPLIGVWLSGTLMTLLLVLMALNEPLGRTLVGVYGAALAVNVAAAALVFVARRAPARASSDAGAAAAVLEVHRRLTASPLEGVGVWIVFTGAGRAHQEGMDTFLRLRGDRQPRPLLVMSLQELGGAPLQAIVSEGPLLRQHHRPTGPALVERLQWAGVRLPHADRAEPTDARAATLLGYRALSLTGAGGASTVADVEQAADVMETLLRWYHADLSRLPDDRSEVARWMRAVSEPSEAGGEVVAS